ncbi:MAG: HK97 family phage prohead protease [Labedaea sp.]
MRDSYARAFALDNIEIVSRAKGGDGRTVEAYAAVFNTPTEVHDRNGDYMEIIHPTAFNRTLSQGAVARALYLFNHGLGVTTGQPDSLAQVPIGSPKSIQADGRGLRTVAQLNRSALADATLEAVKAGDIKGYSFRGNAYRSDPAKTPRVKRGEALPTVTRMELSLADFGPTPTPYYEKAEILAVRSAGLLFSEIAGLDEPDRADLFRMLLAATQLAADPAAPPAADPAPGPEDPAPVARSSRDKDRDRQRQLALWAEVSRMEMATK